jgi:PmbA protein
VIARLLELAAARADAADVRVADDETLVLTLTDDAVSSAAALAEEGTCVRVVREGRVGHAGTTDQDTEILVDRALASAAASDPLPLLLPGASPLPPVITHDAEASSLGLEALADLGWRLSGRVRRDGRHVMVHLERSVGSVRLGNTRGVDAAYDASLVAMELSVLRTADGVVATSRCTSVSVPDDQVLDQLAADVERQLEWARSSAMVPSVPGPVLLMPTAVRDLLVPILDALVLRSEPPSLQLHRSITLRDDPWLELRPGSRAIDDDGVTTWPQVLVEEGALRHCVVDLETGAASRRPATGHGRRTTFGRAHAGFSNLLLAPGEASLAEMVDAVGDGLLVERITGAAGIGRAGAIHLPVALGYRIRGGEVQGRVEGAVLAGNAFDALAAVGMVGRDRTWIGSSYLPALLVEGLTVAGT